MTEQQSSWRWRRWSSVAAILAATVLLGAAADDRSAVAAACTGRDATFVRWVRVSPDREREAIDQWCAAVGKPARATAGSGPRTLNGPFVIVSWNTHVGAGDIETFVADLRAGRLTRGVAVSSFVLLLQETYRAGSAVPDSSTGDLRWASAQQPSRAPGTRRDVTSVAARLGLDMIYVPSMRNGAPAATDEDRGNAVLSSSPLSDIAAIELPLEHQRRVAIQAVVHVRTAEGNDVPVTIVDTHFTNMVLHHLWVLSESGRLRQARALADALPPRGALIVGGDFNAWFGFHDAAYRQMQQVAQAVPNQDRRA